MQILLILALFVSVAMTLLVPAWRGVARQG
jgi:hypothetical protein